MNQFENQAGNPVPTRGSALKQAWERFAAADRNLFDARESVRQHDQQTQVAYEVKAQSEAEWTAASEQLMNIMIDEAPDSIRAQHKQQIYQAEMAAKAQTEPKPPTQAIPGGQIGGLRRSY